jgi:hypothetical protein
MDHEQQDLRYSLLLKVWLGLLVCLVLVGGIAALVLHGMKTKSLFLESGPLVQWRGRHEPPKPRLQQDPSVDLRKLRESEDALLLHYGWADRSNGRVRIPISRAMDLLAEHGVPTRKKIPAAPGARQ